MASKRQGPIIFSELAPYEGIKKGLVLGRSEVLNLVRKSNLRGRGGAGFPTGVKWNLAATTSADKKYVVCNADEGEPGTFKDRVLLTEYAPLIFEAMILGAFAIGADEGFLYLRGEYRAMKTPLENILKQMRKDNALGKNIFGQKGFNFDICIRLGVGAYVCGEETALIESLEGHRGESRNRPPFPVNTGFHGAPTIVNNVETFASITHIIAKGTQWFTSFGTEHSSGSKLLSISGDCKKPGVYEVEFGTSIKQILKMVGAENTHAVQVGGASGVCIVPKEFTRIIGYEDLSTGGSIIIFNKTRNMLDVAENFLEFFCDESCGQCTPCREGVPTLLEYLQKIKANQCTKTDMLQIESLCETLSYASKCGLGQSVPNALLSILNHFKKEYRLIANK